MAEHERLDFVEFKTRVTRIAEKLLQVRGKPNTGAARMYGLAESVDVRLTSESVTVAFLVDSLSATMLSRVIASFAETFGTGWDSILVLEPLPTRLSVRNTIKDDSGFITRYQTGAVVLTIDATSRISLPELRVSCPLDSFHDHFEVFVVQVMEIVYPPQVAADGRSRDRPAHDESETDRSRTEWDRRHRSEFEFWGCVVPGEDSFTLEDLAGMEPVLRQLTSTVLEPLQRRDLLAKIVRHVLPSDSNWLPRGVLLHGPPGCGKTRSMRVIGSVAGLPVVILPVQAVLTKWFGESEQRLAKILTRARTAGPMILLIDELDALGRSRGDSSETSARLVSILLADMDGLQEDSRTVIVGAVNDPGALDPALLDRFDTRVRFPKPGPQAIASVFRYYARHLAGADVELVASRMDGWSFRQIARFSEGVVRRYVSGLDLSQLQATDPPLPRVEDYLSALEEHGTAVER